MSDISEKAIKLIKDLRRDISIDIMFTPEKNAEDDSLKQLVDYIAELEGENAGLKEELQQEKTRSQLNLEAEERRMLNITYYCAEIDRLNARIAELEAENVGLKERVAMLDVTAVFKSLGEMGYIEQTNKLHTRIAELEGLVDELIEAGDAMSNAHSMWVAEEDKWDALVKDWKERER